jgi:hypothetical protein
MVGPRSTVLDLVPLTSIAWLAVGLGIATSWLAAELTARALARLPSVDT